MIQNLEIWRCIAKVVSAVLSVQVHVVFNSLPRTCAFLTIIIQNKRTKLLCMFKWYLWLLEILAAFVEVCCNMFVTWLSVVIMISKQLNEHIRSVGIFFMPHHDTWLDYLVLVCLLSCQSISE